MYTLDDSRNDIRGVVNWLVDGYPDEYHGPVDLMHDFLILGEMIGKISLLAVEPVRWHDLEKIASDAYDGGLRDWGDTADDWARLCRIAGKLPPTEPMPPDIPIDDYLRRFTFPRAQELADRLGIDWEPPTGMLGIPGPDD